MPKITKSKRPKLRVTQPKSKAERLSDAYERLGVSESEVSRSPQITQILKLSLESGLDSALEFLRGSHEPDARKFLDVYDSIPNSVRIVLPIEAFCVASGLGSKRVLELITGACFEQSANVAELISRSARPKLVKVAVDQAMSPENFDERKLVLQHEGYAPVPKTQVVNIGGDVNTDNRIQSISVNELTGLEKSMGKLNDRFNDRLGIGPVAEVDLIPESVEEDSSVEP